MNVGLPGTGVGGMFYLLSALVMPLREAYGRTRGRRGPGGWRAVAKLTGMAAGILAGMWVTGWLLGLALGGIQAAIPAVVPGGGGAPPRNALRTAALAISIGTLAAVLLGVQVLRLWVRRTAAAEPATDDREDPRRVASAGTRTLVLCLGFMASVGAHGATAQSFTRGDTASPPANERAAVMERARLLARDGRTDGAIAVYEAWLAAHPRDADAWRDLARQWQRAGRPGDALRALESAQTLTPDPATGRRLAWLRGAAAPAFTPLVGGTRDSDGNTTFKLGAAGELRAVGTTRLGASFARDQVTNGLTTANLSNATARLAWRPRAVLRVDLDAGATRLGAFDSTDAATVATGVLRVRWRAPAAGPALDIRVQRSPVTATPLLVANGVVRTEVRGLVEFPVARGLKVRGIGRSADLSDAARFLQPQPDLQPPDNPRRHYPPQPPDSTGPPQPFEPLPPGRAGRDNHRTAVGAVLALAATPAVEVSAQFHEIRYARPSTAGYFAPRRAQVVEAGSYIEFENSRSVLFAVDVGLGAQRVAEHGAPAGPWRRAVRLYGLVVAPLAPGRDLKLELECEDSSIAEAATSGRWQYASAAISVRWGLRQ